MDGGEDLLLGGRDRDQALTGVVVVHAESVGHARQELNIRQGLEGDKAKEIIQAIKSQGFKVQSQLQDRQIRVTGKKKDDLQAVIQFVRSRDFGVAANFKNFRD